ncbi:MAG: HAMP domain-containing histidine kinase [Planctomycetes bacterium]|nr:HAMP domain-containing histidine kinase [Planctomycetota bacterium]
MNEPPGAVPAAARAAAAEIFSQTVHDLRTPLHAILGFTSTLLARLPGPLNAEQERQLGLIQRSATSMLGQVEDLLEFASGERASAPREHVCFDLCALVRETLESIEPLARERGLRLRSRLPGAALELDSDPRAWTRILQNLVANALKFSETGEVLVELERVHADSTSELRLRIVDHGIGIAPDALARLFRPFERLHPDAAPGSGLGLYSAQRIARQLGGAIEYRPTPGGGSTFELRVPEA